MRTLKFEVGIEQQNTNLFVIRLKTKLKEMAKEIYDCMSDDIALTKQDYATHYSNLGQVLYDIEKIESFTGFLTSCINGKFQEIVDINDEVVFQDFISQI